MLRCVVLGRDIRAYGPVPRLWGLAYRKYNSDAGVYYIVPLNWIVRWARSAWIAVKFPGRDTWIEKREIAAYQHGFDVGVRAGKLQGEQDERARLRGEFLKLRGA